MGKHQIFSATLGLTSTWKITSVAFTEGSNRMDIGLQLRQDSTLICPVCGAEGTATAQEPRAETWHHYNFLSYSTYLHAVVPHLLCRCGIFPLERPWCREGSRFLRCTELAAPNPALPAEEKAASPKDS